MIKYILISIFLALSLNIIAQQQINKAYNPTLNCQDFTISLISSTPAFTYNNGVYTIKACLNDSISINAAGQYPNNNTTYVQNDSTTIFNWTINNQPDTNTYHSTTLTFSSSAIHTVSLTATDTNNCNSTNYIIIEILIAPIPSFTGTIATDNEICIGDSTSINANVTPKIINATLNILDTTYIPDGSGVTYTSDIIISNYPNQVIQDSNGIAISAKIEHSYLGDLNIEIICPNGQSSILKAYPGGNSNYLGEPIDNNAQQIAGIGYEYQWSSQGTITMTNASNTYTHNFTDLTGVSHTGSDYLPPSTIYPVNSTASAPYPIVSYLPDISFTSLIGCPINGIWQLSITDNLSVDNGFVFGWGIDLTINNLISQHIASQSWNVSSSITNINGNTITVLPTDTGINQYTYTVVDSFACSFDTTINIHSLPLPEINLGNDTTLCGNQSITLYSGDNTNTQFWSTGSSLPSITLDSTSIGYNSLEVTVYITDYNGCTNTDTILISFTNCTSIESNSSKNFDLKLFPNPSNGIINISGYSKDPNNINLELISLSGSIIFHKTIMINNEINEVLDLRQFTKGSYLLKISTSDSNQIIPILITK